MNKTEISAKIRKRKKIKVKQNIKQIQEAVQALESNIGFWWPSWILQKKLKNAKKFIGLIP